VRIASITMAMRISPFCLPCQRFTSSLSGEGFVESEGMAGKTWIAAAQLLGKNLANSEFGLRPMIAFTVSGVVTVTE